MASYKVRKDKQALVKSRLKELYPNTSEDDIGNKLGVSRGTIQNFKHGKANIAHDTFELICKKLGLPWWEIAEIPPELLKLLEGDSSSNVNLLPPSNSAIVHTINHPSEISPSVTQKETTALTVYSFPDIFDAFVAERTWHFAGRRKIFDEIDNFIDNNPCGYFTIVGLPGSGKSSILARYASYEYKNKGDESEIVCVAYYNNRNEGYSSVRECLRRICKGIIDKLNLDIELPTDYSNSGPLNSVLSKASKKLQKEKKLVIVIDALDEIKQTAGTNILYLPLNLPDNVYFLLSRRYSSDSEIQLAVNTPEDSIDISSDNYSEDGFSSIRQYLENIIDSEDPRYKGKLKDWIMGKIDPKLPQRERDKQYQVKENEFITTIMEKSELNFMYVRYIVRDFASGKYDNLELKKLPQGLKQYYNCHWNLMELTKEEPILYLRFSILYILIKSGCKVSFETIKDRLLEISRYKLLDEPVLDFGICKVIENWLQFLSFSYEVDEQLIPIYSIYHQSFNDFLVEKYTTIPQSFLQSLVSSLAVY